MTTVAKKEKARAAAWKMTPGKLLGYLFMYLFALLCLIPLIWMVRTAFIPQQHALDLFHLAWPTLNNFSRIWNAASWTTYMRTPLSSWAVCC